MIGPFQDMDDYTDLMTRVVPAEERQAMALGGILIDLLSPTSVIDLGCACGIYLRPFLVTGADVLGVDGCAAGGGSIPSDLFIRKDLRFPYQPPRRYDLALCIEVAEHLKPEYADTLMDTLARCSDTVFFTAARPRQGGYCHHNERPKSYWIDRFAERGYTMSPLHDTVLSRILAWPHGINAGWLHTNMLLMQRSA